MKKFYDVAITVLAVISIIIAIADICGKIPEGSNIFYIADTVILLIFGVDYVVRFIVSDSKKQFFKENIFDLIAVIPFNSIFSFFRFARLFRLAKLSRLTKFAKFARVIGILGKLNRKIKQFLHTNGFIYMLYTAVVLIVISALLISYVEQKSFGDALWWSIVTCTTVGYGDISPSTPTGRIIAVILMIFGIGLISMLTGTITTFFTKPKQSNAKDFDEIINDLDDTQKQQLLDIAKILKGD